MCIGRFWKKKIFFRPEISAHFYAHLKFKKKGKICFFFCEISSQASFLVQNEKKSFFFSILSKLFVVFILQLFFGKNPFFRLFYSLWEKWALLKKKLKYKNNKASYKNPSRYVFYNFDKIQKKKNVFHFGPKMTPVRIFHKNKQILPFFKFQMGIKMCRNFWPEKNSFQNRRIYTSLSF